MSPSLPLVPQGQVLGWQVPNPSELSWAQLFIGETGESDHGTVCSEGYQAHGNSQGIDASEEEPWAQLFWKPASLDLQPRKQ